MKKFTLTLHSGATRTLKSTSTIQAVNTVLEIEGVGFNEVKIIKIHATL